VKNSIDLEMQGKPTFFKAQQILNRANQKTSRSTKGAQLEKIKMTSVHTPPPSWEEASNSLFKFIRY
jgi:hypothetical protein